MKADTWNGSIHNPLEARRQATRRRKFTYPASTAKTIAANVITIAGSKNLFSVRAISADIGISEASLAALRSENRLTENTMIKIRQWAQKFQRENVSTKVL